MKRVLFLCSAVLVISTHTAWSSIVFSGDFTAGTGQIEITAPIEFPITRNAAPSFSSIRAIAFDEIVSNDGSETPGGTFPNNFSVSIDGSLFTLGQASFRDNPSGTFNGDLSANDGGFFDLLTTGGSPITVTAGQTFRLEAQTLTGIGGPGFNPQYNSLGTFNGNAFLIASQDDLLISPIVSVPEPGMMTLVLGGSVGLLLFGRAFRRG